MIQERSKAMIDILKRLSHSDTRTYRKAEVRFFLDDNRPIEHLIEAVWLIPCFPHREAFILPSIAKSIVAQATQPGSQIPTESKPSGRKWDDFDGS
jgi:hypothetical protein